MNYVRPFVPSLRARLHPGVAHARRRQTLNELAHVELSVEVRCRPAFGKGHHRRRRRRRRQALLEGGGGLATAASGGSSGRGVPAVVEIA